MAEKPSEEHDMQRPQFELRNIAIWLYGLMSAMISSAAGAVAVVVVDPKTFNFDEGLDNLLTVTMVMALVALYNYLQKHPLPEWEHQRRRNNYDEDHRLD